ncbi:transcriptional regulator [Aliidiomarina taiwanensis]|uniref:Transcriptional regulator n=1 Tax=Aliidiomarina taiwanensis TaxID=946228 RepID=A0A432WTL8_9GAMM|nr:BolA/IbaG family iron-sulfur metabolism protein [Aliidiomarina taiwanensis]RUO37120.1 transcriptional regulator [Aliidiomarina taiwanensis]
MSRKHTIETKLTMAFSPEVLQVEDESYKHAAGPEAQSHFKVVVVSTHFEGQRLLARHCAVNEALAEEFAAGMHALAIHAFTPEEWAARNEQAQASPNCMGGGA